MTGFNENIESLSKQIYPKALKGFFWVFLTRLFQQIPYTFVKIFIFANILDPKDFGLLGYTTITMSIFSIFTETGHKAFLIIKKNSSQNLQDAAWTIGLIRGIVLNVITFFAAPLVALFFNAPSVTSLIQLTSFNFTLISLINIKIINFHKQLDFKKDFFFQTISNLVDLIVSLILIIILRNLWAIIIGKMAAALVKTTLSYVIIPYIPRLRFKYSEFHEIWSMGKWLFGGSIINYLSSEGDDLFVGKYLGPELMGLYRFAYNLSNMYLTEIGSVISKVTFPSYVIIKDESNRLRDAYEKSLKIISLISFFVSCFIFLFSKHFITIFLKPAWHPMIPTMQILATWGIFRIFGTTAGPLFNAIGKPKISFYGLLIRLSFMILLIYPLTNIWGINGTALTVLISSALAQPYVVYMTKENINFGFRDYYKCISSPLIATIVMFLTISMVEIWLQPELNILNFFALALISIIIYVSILFLLDHFIHSQNLTILMQEINSFKKLYLKKNNET